jgi:LPS-assembly lipoprotein
MSSPSKVKLAGAMALALATGGCFTPLYGEAAHPGLSDDMRAIVVAPINPPGEGGKTSPTGIAYGVDRVDRVGHYLRDDLIFALNGTGETPPPKYRLVVSTTQFTATPTIESQEGLATAAIVQITATYRLQQYDGGAAILTGTAVSSKTQDIFLTRYGNLRAARDSEIRIAKSLADEIELRIAAGLADKGAH